MLAGAFPAHAEDFNTSVILSDTELTRTDVPAGFSQAFLESRGSGIAKMRFQDLFVDGSMMRPGDMIDLYGKLLGVNPRFLLALIQKEQSLVTDPDPSPCQIMWAAGYDRPDGSSCTDPVLQARSGGFNKQVLLAAQYVRYFYDQDALGLRRNFGYHPGEAAVIDGQTIVPGNIATAMLYSYTPHFHGNQNLVRLWSGWFSLGYPDGTALKGGDGTVYLIQGGLKRRFANNGALKTRIDASRIIPVSDAILNGFQDGAAIKFSDYTLVRVPSGTVYLLTGDRKRPVQSMEVFRSIGFNPEEIDEVTDEDLAPYAEGDMITLKSAYPTGTLLQNNKTGGVYFVEDGVKRPIVSAEIMKVNYPNKKISAISPEALAKYPSAEPVRFRDGELITSPGSGKAIFVVSNGMRRPIISGQVFEQLGYSWARIIYTSDAAVNMHPLGEAVTALPTTTGTQTALAL